MPQPCCGPDCAAADAPPECISRWTITAGAIFLHAFRPPARLLVEDFLNGPEVLDVHNVAAQWGEGPRVDAIRRYDGGCGVELLYYGISNWERNQSPHSDLGALYVPLLSQSLTYDDVNATARTDLYNAEFNIRHEITPAITGLVGFRFLELRDSLSVLGTFPGEADRRVLEGQQLAVRPASRRRREAGPVAVEGLLRQLPLSRAACTTTSSRGPTLSPVR